MSDLTFTDNGNPNFHPDGLINFSKCRLIYNQIRDLVLRQDKSYNFEEVPALHEGITKFHFLDTDVLYDVSLQREPRCVCMYVWFRGWGKGVNWWFSDCVKHTW